MKKNQSYLFLMESMNYGQGSSIVSPYQQLNYGLQKGFGLPRSSTALLMNIHISLPNNP